MKLGFALGPLLAVAVVSTIPAAPPDPAMLAGLSARAIGPATMSGRIAAIDVVLADPSVIYVGAATGGVWKSTNAGVSWKPLFDREEVHAVGAVTVDQSRPEIVWVGTGEGNPRNSASVGDGIYRSADGGKKWQRMGLRRTERIHRILIDPTAPDTVFAAAMGTTWGENAERGVYRTKDAGKSWEHVLVVDERTGCCDLVMDPTNPQKLFAAMWDHRREPFHFRSGGPGSGIYVTRDGGDSWQRLDDSNGLPSGDLGRVGLAIAPSNPLIVYAYIEARDNAVYRSNDGGQQWKKVSSGDNVGNRPFYYADIRVDPKDPDRVYSLWSIVSVSDDGAKSFKVLIPYRDIHPDHHELWIHPERPEFMINGNDGGIAISQDRGRSWRYITNLPLAQFYHIRYDLERPYNVYGGLQDNGSWRGPSSVWENGGIRNHHWQEVCFGDGFDTVPDPRDPMQGFAMSQEGYLVRWNARTGERKMIRPVGPEGTKLRFNWNAAIALHPADPDTVYFGSQFVHRSRDGGDSWEIISGDLTTNNPEWQKQDESGGLTLDVTGAENYTSLVTIAVSEINHDLIWAGSDDGRIHVSRDAGASWTSVEGNLSGAPEHTWVAQIVPSLHEEGTAFAVLDDHRRANWDSYLYRTTDYGETWANLADETVSGYCLSMAEDPVDPQLLFVGTEFGLFFSTNGGEAWARFNHGVPHCSVKDLAIHPRDYDLIVATHGRAIFIVDDIRALRGLDSEVLEQPLTLFDVAPAQQYWVAQTGSSRFAGGTEFRGENRPYGALITYSLYADDIPHPDEEEEHKRKMQRKERKKAEQEAGNEGSGEVADSEGDAAADTAGEGASDDTDGDAEEGEEDKKDKHRKKVKIEILDRNGEAVRTVRRDAKLGVQRFVWNLRGKGHRSPGSARKKDDAEPQGPGVLPGEYQVRLTFRGETQTRTFVVLADPRVSIPTPDRQAKLDAQLRIGALRECIAGVFDKLRETKADLGRISTRLQELEVAAADAAAAGDDNDDEDPLRKQIKETRKRIKELERLFRRPKDSKGIPPDEGVMSALGTASWAIGSSWEKPTPGQLTLLARAEKQLQEALVECNAFFAEDLPALKKKVADRKIELLPPHEAFELPK
ncbi:MAG: hypothetical protein AAF581_10075 [Planctomycetota bacterium]